MRQGKVSIVQEMGPNEILLTCFEVTVAPCPEYFPSPLSAPAKILGHKQWKEP